MADKKLTPKQKEQMKRFVKRRDELAKKRRDKLKDLFKKRKPSKILEIPKILERMRKKKKDGVISFGELKAIQAKKKKPRVMEAKKGGSAKFPDLSGDGKVTQKDILIGRGVIKRKKGGPVDKPSKKKSLAAKAAELIKKQLEKRRKLLPFVTTGPRRVPRPKLPKPMDPKAPRQVPRPQLPKPRVPGRPPRVTPAGPRRKRRMMADGGFSGRAGIAFSADNKLRRGLKRISDSDAKFNRERKARKAGRLAKRGYGKAR